MGNTDAVASILRHCQKMSGFWALLATKSFKLVKTLINIWASGEDTCRILAFLAIIRIANYNREVFLLRLYKVSQACENEFGIVDNKLLVPFAANVHGVRSKFKIHICEHLACIELDEKQFD